MIIRLWCFLTRGRLVWLRDYDGDYRLSIARKSPFGPLMAERHWPWSIRRVTLNDDGSVSNGCYVVAWKDA